MRSMNPAPTEATMTAANLDSSQAGNSSRQSSGQRWKIAVGVLSLAALAGVLYWMFFRPTTPQSVPAEKHPESDFPPDPRSSYKGPFRNIQPDVAYVGAAACATCHQDIERTYSKHPMGRSMMPVAALAGEQLYDKSHHNPFEAFDIRFRVDRQGDHVYHRQTRLDTDGKPIYEFSHEVDFVIGSGARGHSYLTVRDGFVFQTPISWFSQKQIWDLSPGFPPWARAGRMVPDACLSCHTNHVEPVENTRNRYTEPVFHDHAIGCERCHGPGELHIRTSLKDDIVNPKRLDLRLREAVCQQCHLEGEARVLRRGRGLNDYRPGMPLDDFVRVFITGAGKGEEHKAVNHVEQMYQSLCFQRKSRMQLGCTSCHNPHEAVAPAERVSYYRARCMECHEDHGCSLPEGIRRKQNADDSCIACHMPTSATSDIVHTAASDHRIIRQVGVEPTNRRTSRAAPEPPLVDFYRGVPDTADKEVARDLALAYYQRMLRGIPLPGADGEFVLGLLRRAVHDCPADLDAREALGKLLQVMQRAENAIDVLEALLERAPGHEGGLATLGMLYREKGQFALALPYWRRVVEVNPWYAEYRRNLTLHLAELNEWKELLPQSQKWLELDPASIEARRALVAALIKNGRKSEAELEFAKIRALRPPELPKLEIWFAEQIR
jgi:tetratricopeptide (TPR) repeat protein